ncbi:hypothetical protein SAMN02746000_03372 [Paracoccus sp. J56]|nr:hypothetical protein SAMN02746000_03372 [Paracoccus sp. J56]
MRRASASPIEFCFNDVNFPDQSLICWRWRFGHSDRNARVAPAFAGALAEPRQNGFAVPEQARRFHACPLLVKHPLSSCRTGSCRP